MLRMWCCCGRWPASGSTRGCDKACLHDTQRANSKAVFPVGCLGNAPCMLSMCRALPIRQGCIGKDQAGSDHPPPPEQPQQCHTVGICCLVTSVQTATLHNTHLSLCSAASGFPGMHPDMCASCDTCRPSARARRSVGSCQSSDWSLGP